MTQFSVTPCTRNRILGTEIFLSGTSTLPAMVHKRYLSNFSGTGSGLSPLLPDVTILWWVDDGWVIHHGLPANCSASDCVCVHVCDYVYTCVSVCMCECMHCVHVCECIHVTECVHVCECVHVTECVHVCECLHKWDCVHTCVSVCM